jgi:hypothetical protein
MNRNDLEASLATLAGEIEYPFTPDLVAPVRAAITAQAPARGGWFQRPVFRRASFLVASVALLLGALVTFSPATRDAIADLLGISGVEVRTSPGRPSPEVSASAPDVGLGERVTLEQARTAVDFDVALPRSLGAPDHIYLDGFVPGGKVSLVYANVPGAPGIGGSDIGVVLSLFPGELDRAYVDKTVHLEATKVDAVAVNGAPGFFIKGGPHEVVYLAPDGGERVDTLRLAGNTLLWESQGVAYRLETSLGKQASLEVAESLE